MAKRSCHQSRSELWVARQIPTLMTPLRDDGRSNGSEAAALFPFAPTLAELPIYPPLEGCPDHVPRQNGAHEENG
jgi:hypothetical protein